MADKTFYLTTPLYYTNSTPHIGHAYSTLAADVIARHHRGLGRAVHFLTGTDEHGPKVAEAAAAAGKSPKQFCDEIVARWKDQWRELDVSYDQFIRTTDEDHERAVQQIYSRLKQRGLIVPGTYEGWYCRNDETFWLERQLVDGRCPNPECRRQVEWVSEPAWFFKLAAYRERLIEYYRAHPGWVQPASGYNEMMSILQGGLEDLCVTRVAVTWGIPVPDEAGKTIYVWFDAICNYITAAGYPHDMERFERLWPANVQLIGKEILRFHAIIWPAILMALELPLPKLVFANGWITMAGEKMSKSKGNVLRPAELIDATSLDSVRYALFAQAAYGSDFSFSEEDLIRRHNAELANDFGNLVQRSLTMLDRYRGAVVPTVPKPGEVAAMVAAAPTAVDEALQRLDFRAALTTVWDLVHGLNLLVEQRKPWDLAKTGDHVALDATLYELCEGLRWVAALAAPFMPRSCTAVWRALGQPGEPRAADLRWGGLAPGTRTSVPPALFPRIDVHVATP